MKQRGPLIAAIAGALVVVLVIAMLILPKLSQIHATKDQLVAAQAQQASLDTQLAELKATEQRAKAIRTQLDLLDAAVPQETNLPDLIRTLNATANQSGVDFMQITPASPQTVAGGSGAAGTTSTTSTEAATPTPTATETIPPVAGTGTIGTGTQLPVGISLLPINITVNGSYFAVDEYLFLLETLPRISKVLSVALTAGPKNYPQLALTITVNFYTTDTSAGPGAQSGAQAQGGVPPAPGAVTTPPAGGSNPTPTGTLPG